MLQRLLPFFAILLLVSNTFAQPNIVRIDPPFWWAGMKQQRVQLLVMGNGLGSWLISTDYPGVKVAGVDPAPSGNHLFVTLDIMREAQPGKMKLQFLGGDKDHTITYELKARQVGGNRMQGITQADLIYLILPDRFANGDPSNDVVKGMQQTTLNRDSMFLRHGGDLQGIINHLDYIQSLGVTALWINPVQENDQPLESYHGYAMTDLYKVDARLGNNELYLKLVDQCHDKGLKVIMDVVYNHWGNQHYLYQDLPEPDWVHRWDEFQRTSYRAPTLMDPYASQQDKKIMTDGWFDHHMPDLNQQNKHLATYLIQNSIWWIEYAGLDGFRIDTYAYPDQDFMADLVKAILDEYPQFGIFGETWVHGVPVQDFFTEKKPNEPGKNSHLPGVTDFQLYYAINEALTKPFGWTEGVARIYYTLAKDYVYNDPTKNVVFLDNHDLSRYYSMVGENLNKWKMGVAFLMTTRGIPMYYYGTEILMKNFANPDGLVREDFPGGWEGDPINKFSKEGRTPEEQEAFEFITKLGQYRQKSEVLQKGNLMQFVPEDGVYVYFRYLETRTVMVILNSNNKDVQVNMKRFEERLQGREMGIDVISGKDMGLQPVHVNAWGVRVIELIP